MTNKELQEKLRQYPDDMPVMVFDEYLDRYPIESIVKENLCDCGVTDINEYECDCVSKDFVLIMHRG